MSQKKHKKRHPQQKRNAASAPAMESEFALRRPPASV